jgi:hypothetical protein
MSIFLEPRLCTLISMSAAFSVWACTGDNQHEIEYKDTISVPICNTKTPNSALISGLTWTHKDFPYKGFPEREPSCILAPCAVIITHIAAAFALKQFLINFSGYILCMQIIFNNAARTRPAAVHNCRVHRVRERAYYGE